MSSNFWNPAGHGTAELLPDIKPVVLSAAEIENIPKESFDGDPCRCSPGGGWRQIFSNPTTPTNKLNIGTAYFPPRTQMQESFEALHRHKQAEFYFMLKGQCIAKIDGVGYECKPGHALFIPGNAEHGFWNTSETEELVSLWGFAANGYHEIAYRFSEGNRLFGDR